MFDSVRYIRELCRQRKLPVSTLERALGFSNGYLNPKKLKKLPYDRAVQIAEYLNVPVECLLTGQKEKPATVSGDGQDPNTVRIAGRDGSLFSKRLTDEQLSALKSIIEQMPEADADYL